jgi:hypothetical protein
MREIGIRMAKNSFEVTDAVKILHRGHMVVLLIAKLGRSVDEKVHSTSIGR